ncbi:MAG: glycosyltransferase family 4 protein [Deltaproteobacteria bacterium]|nr:glycosyltransferase family 4 protein [Deltaproteobacteria bacterium]
MGIESKTFAWLSRAPNAPQYLWRRLWMAVHLGRKRLTELVELSLGRFSPELVEDALGKALRRTPSPATKARRQLFAVALELLPVGAGLGFLRSNWSRVRSDRYARLFAARWLRKQGSVTMARGLLRNVDPAEQRLAAQLDSELRTLGSELAMPAAAENEPGGGPVAYLLAQALPFHSKGYATRSHWLLRALVESGWPIEAHTRFGYPSDRGDWVELDTADRTIDLVSYHYHPASRGYRHLTLEEYQRAAVDSLVATLETERPALIHAASDFQVGLVGAESARRLGVPYVYEMRGMWHLSRAAARPGYYGSEHFELCEQLELQAARAADRVLVITNALRDFLIDHEIPAQRIAVVPNGVDPKAFTPQPRPDGVADQLVVGFVGTFNRYEGLDLLIAAFARAHEKRPHLRLLMVGDGEHKAALEAQVGAHGLGHVVRFTGRVPHSDVGRYYARCELLIYPRRGLPVCEMVSPIKPLEALAMGKAIIRSDVGGHKGLPGAVHSKDDLDDLARVLEELADDPAKRQDLGRRGREWVAAERSWSSIARIVGEIYRELGVSSR